MSYKKWLILESILLGLLVATGSIYIAAKTDEVRSLTIELEVARENALKQAALARQAEAEALRQQSIALAQRDEADRQRELAVQALTECNGESK